MTGILSSAQSLALIEGALGGAEFAALSSYSSAVIEVAASQTGAEIIAAPGAGNQIWVYGMVVMAGTASGTVKFRDGDNTALSGPMAVSNEGGFVWPVCANPAMPWLKVATNKSFEVDTGACSIAGVIVYGVAEV